MFIPRSDFSIEYFRTQNNKQESIGDRIRKQRESLCMTQEELAHKLGYKSRSSVNKVENSRELSNKKVLQYASALNISPAYLMGWEEGSEKAIDNSHDKKIKLLIETTKNYNEKSMERLLAYAEKLKELQEMDDE